MEGAVTKLIKHGHAGAGEWGTDYEALHGGINVTSAALTPRNGIFAPLALCNT